MVHPTSPPSQICCPSTPPCDLPQPGINLRDTYAAVSCTSTQCETRLDISQWVAAGTDTAWLSRRVQGKLVTLQLAVWSSSPLARQPSITVGRWKGNVPVETSGWHLVDVYVPLISLFPAWYQNGRMYAGINMVSINGISGTCISVAWVVLKNLPEISPPLLMTHGVRSSVGAFGTWRTWLERSGYAHWVFSWPWEGDLTAGVPSVNQAIDHLLEFTRCSKFIVIAHSRGNLLFRAAFHADPLYASKAQAFYMLAPPNCGSDKADASCMIYCPTWLGQLTTSWCTERKWSLMAPAGPQAKVLVGTRDIVVQPDSAFCVSPPYINWKLYSSMSPLYKLLDDHTAIHETYCVTVM
jgi:hypothetical protein